MHKTTFTYLLAALFLAAPIRVLAQDNSENLNASVVVADRSVKEIVRSAARNFSSKYIDDYISQVLAIKEISCGGTTREIQAGVGIYVSPCFNQKARKHFYDDPNCRRIYLYDSFVTMPLYPDRNEENTTFNVSQSGIRNNVERFKVEYSDDFMLYEINVKQALEVFSPLNPKRVRDFDYKMISSDSEGYVIAFATKPDVTFKDTRVRCGSGRLHIDKTGFVYKVTVTNLDDRYTTFINYDGDSRVMFLTPYTTTVEYATHNGGIYLKSISKNLRWEKPEKEEKGALAYHSDLNQVRSPFKNKLSFSFQMVFADPVTITTAEIEKLFGLDLKREGNMGGISFGYYRETSDFQYWRRVLEKHIGLKKALSDMGRTWDELCESTIRRQELYLSSMVLDDARADVIKKQQSYYRTASKEVQKVFDKYFDSRME